MELDLVLSGLDANEATLHDLQEWIHAERIPTVRAEPKQIPAGEGKMGPILLTALGVILGAKATVELVRTLHAWIRERKPKVKIRIRTQHGEFDFEAASIRETQALLQQVLEALNAQGA